ncbi:hypothetical protein OIDMADRAFT_62059 [Oidiodendron maius Zn]|uniref:Uncharacterized protein n=1 Tax=Oidiodendron maius (strain Zn) TaxID=913774 RepID=A0A0C3G9Q8_OIDMZ|nr:hypothetical protein OIDMADRAFT_62059 [Oidiodendron maius Zn]
MQGDHLDNNHIDFHHGKSKQRRERAVDTIRDCSKRLLEWFVANEHYVMTVTDEPPTSIQAAMNSTYSEAVKTLHQDNWEGQLEWNIFESSKQMLEWFMQGDSCTQGTMTIVRADCVGPGACPVRVTKIPNSGIRLEKEGGSTLFTPQTLSVSVHVDQIDDYLDGNISNIDPWSYSWSSDNQPTGMAAQLQDILFMFESVDIPRR